MVKVKIPDESKKAKFRRIASARTNRIIDELRKLGNCSNTSAYEFNDEQLNKIFRAIEEQLKDTKSLFKARRKRGISL